MTKQKSAKDFDGDVTRQSCGCVWCDMGKSQFNQDGKIIHYKNMMRNEIVPCTKTS